LELYTKEKPTESGVKHSTIGSNWIQ